MMPGALVGTMIYTTVAERAAMSLVDRRSSVGLFHSIELALLIHHDAGLSRHTILVRGIVGCIDECPLEITT